jgi:hypothetical protein
VWYSEGRYLNEEKPKVLVVAPDSDMMTKRRIEEELDKIAVITHVYEADRLRATYDIEDYKVKPKYNTMSDFVRGHKSKRRKR